MSMNRSASFLPFPSPLRYHEMIMQYFKANFFKDFTLNVKYIPIFLWEETDFHFSIDVGPLRGQTQRAHNP